MEEEDGSGESLARPEVASTSSKVTFLAGCALVSMFGGFAINVFALGRRRIRSAIKSTPEEAHVREDPVLLATRALGWGTVCAVGGVGGFALLIGGIWKV